MKTGVLKTIALTHIRTSQWKAYFLLYDSQGLNFCRVQFNFLVFFPSEGKKNYHIREKSILRLGVRHRFEQPQNKHLLGKALESSLIINARHFIQNSLRVQSQMQISLSQLEKCIVSMTSWKNLQKLNLSWLTAGLLSEFFILSCRTISIENFKELYSVLITWISFSERSCGRIFAMSNAQLETRA